MSAHDSYSSDSGSDSDDAPEVVSLSAARQGTKADQRRRLEEQQRCALLPCAAPAHVLLLTRLPHPRTQAQPRQEERRAGARRGNEEGQGPGGRAGRGRGHPG